MVFAVIHRKLAPHQPRLVAWITEARHQARLLLDRASVLQPGAAFEHQGQQLIVDDHGEAVAAGLPVHITAKLLGHLSANTNQGYIAVYDRDVIEHHQAFIGRRRAQRPSGEHREPTDAE